MHPRTLTRFFIGAAVLVGIGLGLLAWYSTEAIVVKLSVTLPLMAASQVDGSWIMSQSWQGSVAFWLTLILQWIVIGWLASIAWLRFGVKKRNE